MDEEMEEAWCNTPAHANVVPDATECGQHQCTTAMPPARPPSGLGELSDVFATRSRTFHNAGLGRTQSAPAHISPPLRAISSPARPHSHRLPALCGWEAGLGISRERFIDMTVGAIAPPSSPTKMSPPVHAMCDQSHGSACPVPPASPAEPAGLPRTRSPPALQRRTTDPYIQRSDQSMRLKRRRSGGHEATRSPHRHWSPPFLTRSSPDAPKCVDAMHTRTPSPERPSPVLIPSAHSSQLSSPRDSSPEPPVWTRSSSSDEMEYEQEYQAPTPKQPPEANSPSLKSIFVSGTGCEKPISNAMSFCHTGYETLNNYGQETYTKEVLDSAMYIILLMILAAFSACILLQFLCSVSDGFCPSIERITSRIFSTYSANTKM